MSMLEVQGGTQRDRYIVPRAKSVIGTSPTLNDSRKRVMYRQTLLSSLSCIQHKDDSLHAPTPQDD